MCLLGFPGILTVATDGRSATCDEQMTTNVVHLDGAMSEDVSVEMVTPDDRRLVLLMSDDPLMSRALMRLLREAGYEVVAGESGGGSSAAGVRHPALVIIDVPDDQMVRAGDSDEVTPAYQDSSRVLVIGGQRGSSSRQEDHLAKPFTTSQLLSKVTSLLSI
jgi:CheY-like chemotaxis protein